MADAWDQFQDAWDQFSDAPVAPLGSGEPRRGAVPSRARQAENAQNKAKWNDLPWYARATLTPDQMSDSGLAAHNAALADAGAVATNVVADATVNLPGQLTGFGAKVAGQIGRNFDPTIDPSQWREAATWEPFGRSARGDELLGNAVRPLAESWQQNVSPVLERNPALGAAAETLGTAGEAALWALGGRGAVKALEGVGERARAADISHKPYTHAPVADVAKRYTVVPDDVRQSANIPPGSDVSITGSTRANLGPQQTRSTIPAENIRKATANASADLPGRLLDVNGRADEGMLAHARDVQSIPYQQAAMLPAPAENTLAARISAAWQERGGSLKGDALAESKLNPLMDAEQKVLSSNELLVRWRELNRYASDLRKASTGGNVGAQLKGSDLRAIADTILDEIDARAASAGDPGLVNRLKEARVNIGRLHTFEDSLDSVGWVEPHKLAAAADAGVPLTGGLAQVAADARAAPRSLAPLTSALNAQDHVLDRFGREPTSWLRNVAGHMGGNWAARRGVEALNEELRAGSGVLRQEFPPVVAAPAGGAMPPNSGPQTPWTPTPPNSGPGLPLSLAPDLPPGFYSGNPQIVPSPVGPVPTVLPPAPVRDGTFAGQLAVDPPLQGPNLPPRDLALNAQNPGVLPWEPPGAVPPLQMPGRTFADQLGVVSSGTPEVPATPLEIQPTGLSQVVDPNAQTLPWGLPGTAGANGPTPFRGFEPSAVPPSLLLNSTPGAPPVLVGPSPWDEFGGPVFGNPRGDAEFLKGWDWLDEFRDLPPDAPAPVTPPPPPSGPPVQSGAFADQIAPPAADVGALEARALAGEDVIPPEPTLADLLSLVEDTNPARAIPERFVESGPRADPEMVDGLARLYRGVGSGRDPFAAGGSGVGYHLSPDRSVAQTYADYGGGGPGVVGDRLFPLSEFLDAGTLEQLSARAGVPPGEKILIEDLMKRLAQQPGRPRGYTYTIPGNLGHGYREYFRFTDDALE